MLTVHRNFTLNDFEKYLEVIGSGESEISLPSTVSANAEGSMAALIQLVLTWARKAPDHGTLRLHANRLDDLSLVNFVTTPVGLAAVNMAPRILFASGAPADRREVLVRARDYVAKMHEGKLTQLQKINKNFISIFCIDNANELRRPASLYIRNTEKLLDRAKFEDLVMGCYNAMPLSRAQFDEREHVSPIASMLYEAFENSHNYAQADFRGNRYRRSTRGIILGYQQIPIDQLSDKKFPNLDLNEYFYNWKIRGHGNLAKFAEVSIFDSGPGMAEHWLAYKEIISKRIEESDFVSIKMEYEAIIDCLRRGNTSKNTRSRGNGLFRIMQVVKRSGGFIRIRINKISAMPISRTKRNSNISFRVS